MGSNEIIAAISSESAVEGAAIVASEVSSTVIAGDIAIEGQIAAHSEQSEEQHEEILEGQEWLVERMDRLEGLVSSLITTQTASQAILLTQLGELRSSIRPPTPSLIPELPETPIIPETPQSDAEESPAPKIPSTPERATAKRRLI